MVLAVLVLALPHINELKLVKFGGITLQSIHFSFASLAVRLPVCLPRRSQTHMRPQIQLARFHFLCSKVSGSSCHCQLINNFPLVT